MYQYCGGDDGVCTLSCIIRNGNVNPLVAQAISCVSAAIDDRPGMKHDWNLCFHKGSRWEPSPPSDSPLSRDAFLHALIKGMRRILRCSSRLGVCGASWTEFKGLASNFVGCVDSCLLHSKSQLCHCTHPHVANNLTCQQMWTKQACLCL